MDAELRHVFVTALVLSCAACGGSEGTAPMPTPPPTPVRFSAGPFDGPMTYELTLQISPGA